MTMRRLCTRPVLSTIIDRSESIVRKKLGIVDGGASGHVIVNELAQELLVEGLIKSIVSCKEGEITISWGDGDATVIGIARTDGLMDIIYIVNTMSTPLLISEHRLCDKGIIFVKNADCLIGLQHGIMVLYASASPLNPGENPLWLCDIHSLFKVKTIHHPSPTSIPIVQYLTELLESATVLANNSRGSYQVNRIMQGRRNNNIMGRW